MKRATLLTLLCTVLSVASTLPGQAATPPAAGADFQVNVVTAGDQLYPSVAQDTAGRSIVAWLDQGASPAVVKVRIFDAAGAPAGGEIAVASLAPPLAYAPRVAATPLGAFAVVWLDQQGVFLRRFDRLGRPDGEAVHLQQTANDVTISSPAVALDAAGNAFVAWAVSRPQGGVIVLQRLDLASRPVGAVEGVNQFQTGLRGLARVAVGPAASADNVLVSWDDERSGQPEVWARRFDGAGGSWAPEARMSGGGIGFRSGGRPLLGARGEGAVVFTDLTTRTVRVRRLDAGGAPLSGDFALSAADHPAISEPAAALTPDGTALVAWQGDDFLLHAAFFDAAWHPLGTDFTVSSELFYEESQPAVAAGGAGNLLVSWAAGGPLFTFPEIPPGLPTGRDGSERGIFAQRFQDPACAAGSDRLCLGQILGDGSQLFNVQVSWRNPYTGETGTGRSLPLTGDTGAFWFFDPANLEVMIKILDGRPVNGYFWVFYGSLSNVEYTITVTETLTGAVKTYHNPPLQFASQADVQAFLLVSAAAGPAPAALPTGSRASATPALPAAAAPFAAGNCTPTPTTLCPQSRFQVTVSFVDPRTGATGQGQAVTLSDDTGIFWFFDPTNLELMVKVLDGNAINGHFWVFYGGLSDVDYTLTVTDTATGAQRTYPNPRHHLASAADLDAFPAGPTAGKGAERK